MPRVLIFGNSGSGKSTRARALAESGGLAHLDLDVLAWLPAQPPQRRPLDECRQRIAEFTAENDSWVIEGCYADLLKLAEPLTDQMIFMNLDTGQCTANARNRPWEPHKYESRAAQDENLPMLLEWIADYPNRTDDCSLAAHERLFDEFAGPKVRITDNG